MCLDLQWEKNSMRKIAYKIQKKTIKMDYIISVWLTQNKAIMRKQDNPDEVRQKV